MTWLEKLLAQEGVAAALITAVGGIALAIIAWISGAGAFIGRQLEKVIDPWLERRRQQPVVPSKTMHIIPEGGVLPPTWGPHDFGHGRTATDARTFLVVTNLMTFDVVPIRAEVHLRGWDRLRRKPHNINFHGPLGRHREAIPPKTVASWHISFYVLPELIEGSALRADITVFDHFGNPHRVKGVRFTSGLPDALPKEHMQIKEISDQ